MYKLGSFERYSNPMGNLCKSRAPDELELHTHSQLKNKHHSTPPSEERPLSIDVQTNASNIRSAPTPSVRQSYKQREYLNTKTLKIETNSSNAYSSIPAGSESAISPTVFSPSTDIQELLNENKDLTKRTHIFFNLPRFHYCFIRYHTQRSLKEMQDIKSFKNRCRVKHTVQCYTNMYTPDVYIVINT